MLSRAQITRACAGPFLVGLKVNKPRQNETSMDEGEKYNFYVSLPW